MSNYNFDLDMETENSNSIIIKKIKANSRILELGAAHGRMTKYLKEQLNCEITIIEKDLDAGQCAKQYANKAIIGDDGDLNKNAWNSYLQNEKFDYIIFADVLEHLDSPKTVLKQMGELLNNSGSIIISVPNISHNAVIIDLLQEKWTYRDMGILDKTHRWFFTYDSLHSFIKECEFAVVDEINAANALEYTEFKNSYQDLPEEMSNILKQRRYGEVYQFIWELKKMKEVSIIIPVFNKWNFTNSALKDLSLLDPNRVEIIIVDNASTDETPVQMTILQNQMQNLIYIKNDKNLGFGAAVNKGFAYSRGSHIIILNNDIRVQSKKDTWVFDLLQHCSDNNLVGPTGGKVDKANNFNFLYETVDNTKDINYLSGWCIGAKRSVWEKFIDISTNTYRGPFCENYFVYHEDTHLGFKAKELNIDLLMVPVPVVHFGKVSSKQLNTYTLYQQSREIFIKNWKHKI